MKRVFSIRHEDGQSLIVMALVLVVLLGFVGLVIDVGRAYVAQLQLQQAVDAAALAAGQTLPNSTSALQFAIDYSAKGKNAHPYSMTAEDPVVTFRCVPALEADGVTCGANSDPIPATKECIGTPGTVSPSTCNAVQVRQTAKVSMTFGRLFLPNWTVSAKATVGARGGAAKPLDVMVVLDRTGSMENSCDFNVLAPDETTVVISGTSGSNRSTKIDCAKGAIRQLLRGLLPCGKRVSAANCANQPQDKVGLMAFPGLLAPLGTNHDLGTPGTTGVSEQDTVRIVAPGTTTNGTYSGNPGATYAITAASGAPRYSSITRRCAPVATATGGCQDVLSATGTTTVSNLVISNTTNAFDFTSFGFALIKNGTTNVGGCTVNTFSQNCTIDPSQTFAPGDRAVLAMWRASGSGTTARAWTFNSNWSRTVAPAGASFTLSNTKIIYWTQNGLSGGPAGPLTAANFQLRLEELTGAGTISPPTLTGAGTAGNPYAYQFTFQGTLANTNVPDLTATGTGLTASVTIDRQGSPDSVGVPGTHTNLMLETTSSCSGGANAWPPWYTSQSKPFPGWFLGSPTDLGYGTPATVAASEVDRLIVSGSPIGGSFTLLVNGTTTANINWPITTAAIQAQIAAIVGEANVLVTSGPGGSDANPVWTVTFASSLGDVTFTANESLTSGSIAASEITRGSTGSAAVVPTYQIAPLSNDFKTAAAAPGLNAVSPMVNAISWASCPGGSTGGIASETSTGYPNKRYYGLNAGGLTYFTGALTAAQAALEAEAAANPLRDAQPVIILLSDGEANTAVAQPCATAVTAAAAAATPNPPTKKRGTWVYTIAYKLSNLARCRYGTGPEEYESPTITAYHALAQMARNDTNPAVADLTKFFCPGTTPLSSEPCQPGGSLAAVFKSISVQLTKSRIYSDATFGP